MRISFFSGARCSKRLRLNRSAGFSPLQRSVVGQRPTKEVSFLLPGNCNGGESADERGQVFLPLPKGEGRGEGEQRWKIARVVNITPPSPSPLIFHQGRISQISDFKF